VPVKYGVIVSDPAWQFSDKLSMSDTPRGAEANYGVMGLTDIINLNVKAVAAYDSVMLLWVPASLLSAGMCAMDSYGYQQKQIWCWVKTGKGIGVDVEDIQAVPLAFGMGRLARNACEFALVGTRGKVYDKLKNKSIRNVFFAPNLGHSAKPEIVQDALDLMFPSMDKLELFARRDRPGWRCVGLEVPGRSEDVQAFIAAPG
jgi:N6-adenosine-specific RNA methylase IME4